MMDGLSIRMFAGLTPERMYRWWLSELIGCLPDSIRLWLLGNQERLLITRDNGTWLCWRVTNQESILLGRSDSGNIFADIKSHKKSFKRRPLPVYFGIDASLILSCDFQIPGSAVRWIKRIAVNELDRLTPWTVDEVWFDVKVTESNASHDASVPRDAQLVAAPIKSLSDHVKQLNESGLILDGVDVVCMKQDQLVASEYNLLDPLLRRKRRPLRALINLALFLAVLVSLAVDISLTQHRLELHRDLLSKQATSLTEAAQATADLSSNLNTAVKAAKFLVARKNTEPKVIDLLKQITLLIDDDTWLYRLDYESGIVRIHGESSQASRLVPHLDQAQTIKDVRFISPVVRNPRSGGERFSLEFTMEGDPDVSALAIRTDR
ncbi:MAG: hypothetical protein DHS20C01_01710 [marine bacterium B5-7]|nr:MAG: hypothetical protein DHS20C01_01710 [marine bacterium B5-7]